MWCTVGNSLLPEAYTFARSTQKRYNLTTQYLFGYCLDLPVSTHIGRSSCKTTRWWTHVDRTGAFVRQLYDISRLNYMRAAATLNSREGY